MDWEDHVTPGQIPHAGATCDPNSNPNPHQTCRLVAPSTFVRKARPTIFLRQWIRLQDLGSSDATFTRKCLTCSLAVIYNPSLAFRLLHATVKRTPTETASAPHKSKSHLPRASAHMIPVHAGWPHMFGTVPQQCLRATRSLS